MKYTVDIVIDRPVDRVVELFDNPDNLREWMEGLQSFEPISGTQGQPGAKARLVFMMGKRNIEMIETVTARDLPRLFSGIYEAPGVLNVVSNSFQPLPGSKTRYVSIQEYRFSGLFMKAVAFCVPGSFKKQSLKYMKAFKAFVENQPP